MRGYVHSFESFGTVDGPGIRFVVFMQGCPLRCLYCHNPDTQAFGGQVYEAESLYAEILKYERYIASGGVTVSGGEPLLQAGFVAELFSMLKSRGIHTAIDTSGCVYDEENAAAMQTIDALLKNTDLVLLDVKEIDDDRHKILTGKSNRNVFAFLKKLEKEGIDTWIRHVLVPDLTDDDERLKRLAQFVYSHANVKKAEILPYHTMGEVKYEKLGREYPLKGTLPPAAERVQNARRIFAEAQAAAVKKR